MDSFVCRFIVLPQILYNALDNEGHKLNSNELTGNGTKLTSELTPFLDLFTGEVCGIIVRTC